MARLFSSGWEYNSATANMEWTSTTGAIDIPSVNKRSGSYGGGVTAFSSGSRVGWNKVFSSGTGDGPYFFRKYVKFSTLPSAENRCLVISSGTTFATGTVLVYMTIDNNALLKLYDEDGQITGTVTVPNATTSFENYIEVKVDRTPSAGSQIVEAKLNGTVFATSSTRSLSAGFQTFNIGGNLNQEAQTTGEYFFDDVAINDSTGSDQNSYPGSEKLIALRPDAAGDVNTFATRTGGTAGAANNFTRVNEVTPDDVTSFNGDFTVNNEDLFNFEASGLSSTDTINVVHVMGRFRNATTDTACAFRFEIEKTGSGTLATSSNIVPNSTTWKTNSTAAPFIPPITLYKDPDGSAWTNTTLDSLQAGYKMMVAPAVGSRQCSISNIMVYVGYTPAPTTGIKTINGLAKASVKTINGLAIASVKTWNGLA